MSKRWFSFMVLFVVIANLTVISGVSAQIQTVTVTVKGMSCPFCAYGVEKKLKRVEGVKSITVNMQESTAVLSAKKDSSINISQVPKAVKESGFTPGEINIIAIGNVKKDKQQQLFLLITDTDLTIPFFKVKRVLKDRLASYRQTGALVEVRGVVHEESGGAWTLSPETVKEVYR